MVNYKLNYFPARAAGETARLLFALSGKEYEDVRISQEEWPKHKPNAPFGQMPFLDVDGKLLAQSYAINRYLAREFGFAGKSNWDQAQVDALADQYKDFSKEIAPFVYTTLGIREGDKDKLKEEVFVPAIQKHLPFFVNALKANGTGFLVGDSVTWVDLLISDHLQSLSAMAPGAIDSYPELKAHIDKVNAIPQIAEWRNKRPQTAY